MVQKFVTPAGCGASRGGNVCVITAHGTYKYSSVEFLQIQFISLKNNKYNCMVQKSVGPAGHGASRGGNVRVITAHGTYKYSPTTQKYAFGNCLDCLYSLRASKGNGFNRVVSLLSRTVFIIPAIISAI